MVTSPSEQHKTLKKKRKKIMFEPRISTGCSKVLEPFVFAICSKSLGAEKKNYCQIKAEILKFMWVCGKSQFE
jgi:hypothetical protein